jgi:type I restriction enzyme, S subunit
MEAIELKIPKLRFSEFRVNWEMNTLEEIAHFSKGKGLSKSEISEDGNLACIRYGELYTEYGEIIRDVKSRTRIDPKELILSEENDVIIPASGESPIDIATASCVINSGIALGGDLNIIKSKVNGIFLSYYLNNRKKFDIAKLSQGVSVVHLYSSQLKTLKLNLPDDIEQQKIASFLTAVDDKIQQLQRKKELLEQYKKGMMQKIFKQEIRFKDNDGKEFPEWEKKRLGDLTVKVGKKNKDNIKLPIYSINNKKGFLPQSDQFEGMDSNDRGYDISLYKIIQKHTFAYNPSRINVGSIGFSGELENIIISSLYVCFKTTNGLEDKFLLHFLKTYNFNKSVLRNAEGGVRDYLFYENFSNIKLPLPSNEEQLKIAEFLILIDEKIGWVNMQLEKTQSFKKGLLQQMFV